MNSQNPDVIVIGGGPSGIAAAIAMKQRGVRHVLVLERESTLGGATRHCSHSPFGMLEYRRVYFGSAYGRRLTAEAAKAGVDVRTSHSVVRMHDDASVEISSPKGVEKLQAQRILVTTGARETPRSARLISGERPVGVITTGTLQSFIAFHQSMPFRRPLIVGSELVSMSAIITCLTHGARPVAMVEPGPELLARAPFRWLPHMARIPVVQNARIVDIEGRPRVQRVALETGDGQRRSFECDGVLFTGRFTPESALLLNGDFSIQSGSSGPDVDQDGRMQNPLFFAAGNVLRGVETGGWSFREGRAVGQVIARDLQEKPANTTPVTVETTPAIKLIVPNMLRASQIPQAAFENFQLRVWKRTHGALSLKLDGVTVWKKTGEWLPERRILVPIPAQARHAGSIQFDLTEET